MFIFRLEEERKKIEKLMTEMKEMEETRKKIDRIMKEKEQKLAAAVIAICRK
jgi:single-stranded DNA-specific DHH superfamily exonuclease